jgi:hypothetical protein
MAVRVTQTPIAVFRNFSASESNTRVTQISLAVFREDGLLPEDDLDNWQDDVGTSYIEAIIPLELTVADWLSKVPFKGNPNNLKDSWKDGYEIFLAGPDPQLYLSIEDLNQATEDFPEVGIGLILDDTLTLSDNAAQAVGLLQEAYDSLFYFITDSFTLGYSVGDSLSDTLNLTDDINTEKFDLTQSVDTLILTDFIKLILEIKPFVGDTLALIDGADYLGTQDVTPSDTLSMSDAIVALSVLRLTQSVSDDLNNLSDAVGTPASSSWFTDDITYIRRYLNDVI